MEVALFWNFSGWRRVPRAASFHSPVAPLLPSTRPPGSRHACPLPPGPRRLSRAHTIGYRVSEWADHHARYVLNERGQRLFVQEWLPLNAPPKGRILLVHGLNDHSSKYAHVARAFVAAGYAVVSHDAHGHGRSDGFRAHAASIQHYVDDARLALSDSVARSPAGRRRLPTFLLGHSLGGAVAIHLARDLPSASVRGVILTAPAVSVFPRPLLRRLAPLLATFAPLVPVQRPRFDGKNGRGSKDPLVVRCSVRARVGYEVLKSCERIMAEAPRFRAPLFVAHSRRDRVTNPQGSVEFVERVGSKDKRVALYDGKRHDLLAQGDRKNRRKGAPPVVGDMIAWADDRVGNGRRRGPIGWIGAVGRTAGRVVGLR